MAGNLIQDARAAVAQVPTEPVSRYVERLQNDPQFAMQVAGGVVALAVAMILCLELVAAVRSWRALREIEAKRGDALDALEKLGTTADDVIMFSSGSQQQLQDIANDLVAADTRRELDTVVQDGIATIRGLPFDSPGYQALDGSWALEEHAGMAERELVYLQEAIEHHAAAVGMVSFSRWNVVGRVMHGLLYAVYTPRWLAGRLSDSRAVNHEAFDTSGDDSGDRLENEYRAEMPAQAAGSPDATSTVSATEAAGGGQSEESVSELTDIKWSPAVEDDEES